MQTPALGKRQIFLADDHITVLLGLKALIDAQPDMQIVGYATDGAKAIASLKALFARHARTTDSPASLPVDVVVMDVSMPGMNGVEAAAQIHAQWPQVHILALTMHEDRSYLRSLLEAGASGYVLKRSAADELIRAIRAVAAGGRYIDPALSDTIAQSLIRASPPGKDLLRGEVVGTPLSDREEEVLRLIAHGYTNKEIAAQISVSIKTVDTYKARSMEKQGLQSRADIVRYALAQGWLQAGEPESGIVGERDSRRAG